MLAADARTTTIRRLGLLTQEDVGISAGARLKHYSTALGLWKEKPIFGHGLGAYPVVIGAPDVRRYPHNIVLEILAELGVAGLLIALAGAGAAAGRLGGLKRIRTDKLLIVLLMLLTHTLFHSMVSSDITDNRVLWCMAGLVPFVPRKGCSGDEDSASCQRSPGD